MPFDKNKKSHLSPLENKKNNMSSFWIIILDNFKKQIILNV